MRHIVIPDCQVRPGDDIKYLERIGKYIVELKPDVLVQIGDFADMPSLSSYDVGKKSFEGRRYRADIEAANNAMATLLQPLQDFNKRAIRNKEKQYRPKLVLTLGNHEDRISRAVNNDPKLDGTIGLSDLKYSDYGWDVVPFLQPVVIDDIAYCHYFTTGIAGRPSTSAQAQLAKQHMSCIAGHQQGLQIATGHRADGSRLTSIIAGSCLTPDHKVLTADLQYKPLGDIKVGEKLVSFEEESTSGRSRRYKTGTVLAVKRASKEVFEVRLDSGKVFKVTSDHLWFARTGSKYHWRTTESLRVGTCIPKLLGEWDTKNTYDAGWLAGIYDGEGSLYSRRTTGGNVLQLAVAQKEGLVLNKIKETINTLFGFDSTTDCATGRNVQQLRIKGGAAHCAKVLGSIRPIRLLNKFVPEMLGRINCPDNRNHKVVSIKSIGEQEIVQIAIDEKTMIVEGYGHHNCYEHDEDYLGPQGNKHWRGILVLHEVQNGQFDLMPISLNYLERKYG